VGESDEEEKKECLKKMQTSNNWLIWCRSRRKGTEELEEHLSEEGRVFHGKGGEGVKKGRGEPEEREEKKNRTMRSKGWCQALHRKLKTSLPASSSEQPSPWVFRHTALRSTGFIVSGNKARVSARALLFVKSSYKFTLMIQGGIGIPPRTKR
jgi:hypothetical protein